MLDHYGRCQAQHRRLTEVSNSLGSAICVVLNNHLMSVVALRALKHAEVEPHHACRHDASEHHMSMALWAGRAMDVNVDVFGQRMGFGHDEIP